MKKITLFLFILASGIIFAQESETKDEKIRTKKSLFERKHEVKVGALKLLTGVILEGTYEYIQTKDFTFGGSVLVNLDQGNNYYENFAITPFARFYFQESKEYGAKGFFVEGFGKIFSGKSDAYNYNFADPEATQNFTAGALGLCLGKKWVNNSGFVFEILLGGGRVIGGNDNAPQAVFRGDFNIGYRF